MALLPTDLLSFVWGAAVGGAAAVAGGFLGKAGEHIFSYIANRVSSKQPEPIQVCGRFVPMRFEPGECAWVNEVKLYDYEAKGYTYYPHPKGNARCYRVTSDGTRPVKEFLLVQPDAREMSGA